MRAHSGLAELDPVALEGVNANSPRASLFASPAWLSHFIAHDGGFRARGATPYVLTAWEGRLLKGYLPLKATTDHLGRSLSSLITLEVERPRVVAAAEDEERVTQAFFRFLLHRADEWDLLEFVQQDEGSPLFAGPAELGSRHWLRRLDDRQNNVIALPFPDGAAYAGSLSQKMRYGTRRLLKRLLATPGLTMWRGKNPASRSALFEVFRDVERRSWKDRAHAGVGERHETYRAALADPSFESVVCIVCIAGLPIAGSIWVHYGKTTFKLQTIYAESHEDLAPGTLMSCVPIGDAIARRSVAFDLLPDFSHYKSRWGAKAIDTQRVQLFRVGSLRHLKAVAGEFWRRVDPRPPVRAPEGKNPYRVAAGRAAGPASVDLPALERLLATARAAGAIEQDAAAVAAGNPFS